MGEGGAPLSSPQDTRLPQFVFALHKAISLGHMHTEDILVIFHTSPSRQSEKSCLLSALLQFMTVNSQSAPVDGLKLADIFTTSYVCNVAKTLGAVKILFLESFCLVHLLPPFKIGLFWFNF